MNILEVFFWYCKSMGIMGEMWNIYQNANFGTWKYDPSLNQSYYGKCKFKEHLESSCNRYGMTGLFGGLEYCCHNTLYRLMKSEKIKKARRNWGRFVKNNLIVLPSFVKEGDRIHVVTTFTDVEGVIEKITDDKELVVRDSNGRVNYISLFRPITINGEKREPKFIIKKNRKIYGADKE